MEVVVGYPAEKGQFSGGPERFIIKNLQHIFQLLTKRRRVESQHVGGYLTASKGNKDPQTGAEPFCKPGRDPIMERTVQGKRDSDFDGGEGSVEFWLILLSMAVLCGSHGVRQYLSDVSL